MSYIRTPEHKKLMSKRLKGRTFSKETLEKMSKAKQGKSLSEEHKKKIGLSQKGKKVKPFTKEHKQNISKSRLGKFNGKNNPNWKGGKTKQYQLIRNSAEYKEWRNNIFTRDNWTCKLTNLKSDGDIEAHHIKGFAKYPELRFEIKNGITMKKGLHNLFHLIYGKKDNNMEQLVDFLDIIKQMDGCYI